MNDSPQVEIAATWSLLDRLTDLDPNAMVDTVLSSREEMRLFEESIDRDLSALLNARHAEKEFEAGYEEVTNSVLTFGIVDFTPYDLTGPTEQERVRSSIERSIRQFEPRLTRVKVVMAQPDPLKPALQFHVTGLLRTHSTRYRFGVTLHRDSRRISISSERP